MKFKIKYKRMNDWFYKTETVIGSNLDKDLDRLFLYKDDGSVLELAKYSQLTVKLGTDWVLATKEKLEKESNQTVNITT